MKNSSLLKGLVSLATVVCISSTSVQADKPDTNQPNVLNNDANAQQFVQNCCPNSFEQINSWNEVQQTNSLNGMQQFNLVSQKLDEHKDIQEQMLKNQDDTINIMKKMVNCTELLNEVAALKIQKLKEKDRLTNLLQQMLAREAEIAKQKERLVQADNWMTALNESEYNNSNKLKDLYTKRFRSTVDYIKQYINPLFDKNMTEIRNYITDRIINKQKRIDQKIEDQKKLVAQQIADKTIELSLRKGKNGKFQITKKKYKILKQFIEEQNNLLNKYIEDANNFMKLYITTRKGQAEQEMEKLKNIMLQKIADKRAKYAQECIKFKNKANKEAKKIRNKLFNYLSSIPENGGEIKHEKVQRLLTYKKWGRIVEPKYEVERRKKLDNIIDKALKKFSKKKIKYNYVNNCVKE